MSNRSIVGLFKSSPNESDSPQFYLSPNSNDSSSSELLEVKENNNTKSIQNISVMYSEIINENALRNMFHHKIEEICKNDIPYIQSKKLSPVYYINHKDLKGLRHYVILSTNVDISLYIARFNDETYEFANLTRIATYNFLDNKFDRNNYDGDITYSFNEYKERYHYKYDEKILYDGIYSFNVLNKVFLYDEETNRIV